MPSEISLAPVPADVTSGVRSGGDAENEVEIVTLTAYFILLFFQ
jgi:hypothetical protein